MDEQGSKDQSSAIGVSGWIDCLNQATVSTLKIIDGYFVALVVIS